MLGQGAARRQRAVGGYEVIYHISASRVRKGDLRDSALQFDRIVLAKQSALREPLRGVIGEIGLGAAAPLAHELRGAGEFLGSTVGVLACGLMIDRLTIR